MSGEGFISRWSRKKRQAAGGTQEPESAKSEAQGASVGGPHGARHAARADARAPAVPTPAEPAPLPSLDSLTPESDFSPFMRDGVDPDTRRLAVKKLFADPRFNVMDRLDVYIDDYGKPDPLPEGWLEKMNQVARLGVFQPATPESEEDAARDAETPREIAAAAPSHAEILPPPPPAATQPPAVTSGDAGDASQMRESGPDEG